MKEFAASFLSLLEAQLIMLFVCICFAILVAVVGFVLVRWKDCEACGEISSCPRQAVLITGCDSGIGLELARYLYQTTSFTIICGFLKAPDSDGFKLLEQLDANNGRLVLEKLDITSKVDVDNLVNKINELQQVGRIDHLVALINNAGVLAFGEFDWYTWDIIESQVNVNLLGTLRITQAMLPFIMDSHGRIVNTSSIADSALFPFSSIYLTTKSAISRFSKVLSYELARFGVQVITVRPGPCMTNINSASRVQRDKMWRMMDEKKRSLYGRFFNQAYDYLGKQMDAEHPAGYLDVSSVLVYFRQALLSRNPPRTITCLPIHLRVALRLAESLPCWLQEYLLDFVLPPDLKPTRLCRGYASI